jgi:hypothetical protein
MASNPTTTPRFLREALARHFGDDHRTIAAFEQLFNSVETNGATVASNAEATEQLQDATVITLSANATLNNERILKLAPGLKAVDDGEFLTITLEDVARSENYAVTFIAQGDSQLAVPLVGTVLVKEHIGASVFGNYANDAAAAAAGVPIEGLYRNGSVLMVRVV